MAARWLRASLHGCNRADRLSGLGFDIRAWEHIGEGSARRGGAAAVTDSGHSTPPRMTGVTIACAKSSRERTSSLGRKRARDRFCVASHSRAGWWSWVGSVRCAGRPASGPTLRARARAHGRRCYKMQLLHKRRARGRMVANENDCIASHPERKWRTRPCPGHARELTVSGSRLTSTPRLVRDWYAPSLCRHFTRTTG
jgi:hypothetical protein